MTVLKRRYIAKEAAVGALMIGALLVIASCGSSTNSETSKTSTMTPAQLAASTLYTRSIGTLGTVIVNGEGKTLYVFTPDKASKVTCTTPSCTAVWRPDYTKASWYMATASGRAQAALISSDRGPNGTRVITYDGWPLYTYVGDSGGGVATGQALKSSGGLWYVISPSGKVIKVAAATSSPSGGGY